MILPNSYFFNVVDNLYEEIEQPVDKSELFDNCVKDRLTKVLEVQSKYFDDELKNLDNSISWDFSDIKNIKRINTVLTDIHKVIALDRISVIDNLIVLSERGNIG